MTEIYENLWHNNIVSYMQIIKTRPSDFWDRMIRDLLKKSKISRAYIACFSSNTLLRLRGGASYQNFVAVSAGKDHDRKQASRIRLPMHQAVQTALEWAELPPAHFFFVSPMRVTGLLTDSARCFPSHRSWRSCAISRSPRSLLWYAIAFIFSWGLLKDGNNTWKTHPQQGWEQPGEL